MKKILLATAFSFIGVFAMANETDSKEKTEVKSEKIEQSAPCSWWHDVDHCRPYSLCMDRYIEEDGNLNWGQFGLDIMYFDSQKPC